MRVFQPWCWQLHGTSSTPAGCPPRPSSLVPFQVSTPVRWPSSPYPLVTISFSPNIVIASGFERSNCLPHVGYQIVELCCGQIICHPYIGITSEKRWPSCPNWGEGRGIQSDFILPKGFEHQPPKIWVIDQLLVSLEPTADDIKLFSKVFFSSWFGEFGVALCKALTLLFMKIQNWHRCAANYLTSMSMWPKCTGKANLTICTWLLGYTSNQVSAILERYPPWGGTHWQRQSRGSQTIRATGNRSCWTLDPQISSCV